MSASTDDKSMSASTDDKSISALTDDKSMSASTDWNKLTVAQLKGALIRRGLNTDGAKEELVKVLQEWDQSPDKDAADNTEMVITKDSLETSDKGTADNTEMDTKDSLETSVTEFPPMLLKEDVKEPIGLILAMRTVIVSPFKPSVLLDSSFLSWLDESLSFTIKKTNMGFSAAELIFSTVEKGDAVLADLKASLGAEDISVYHPQRHTTVQVRHTEVSYPDDYERMIKKHTRYQGGLYWGRLIVLENVPAELNTEEKLREYFPEALHCYSFEFDPRAKGIAFLDFTSIRKAQEYLDQVGNEIKLLEQPVKVALYKERLSKDWSKFGPIRIQRKRANQEPVETDEDRLTLNAELAQLENQYTAEQKSDECFGQDKLKKLFELRLKIKSAVWQLTKDTNDRLNKEEFTMPEPEEEMHAETKNAIGAKQRFMKKQLQREHQHGESTSMKINAGGRKNRQKKKKNAQSNGNPNNQSQNTSLEDNSQHVPTGQGNQNQNQRKKKDNQGSQPNTGGGQVNRNQQGQMKSQKNQGNQKKNAQKRSASMQNTWEEPPQKMQQMNRKSKRGSRGKKRRPNNSYNTDYYDYEQSDNYTHDGPYQQFDRPVDFQLGAYSVNSRRDSTQDTLEVIKGFTSVLTDKMFQLEEMQKQTLQTHQNLYKQQNLQQPVAPLMGADTGFDPSYPNAGTTGFGSTLSGQVDTSQNVTSSSLGSTGNSSGYGPTDLSGGFNPSSNLGGFNQPKHLTIPQPNQSSFMGGQTSYRNMSNASSNVGASIPTLTGSNVNKAYGFQNSTRRY